MTTYGRQQVEAAITKQNDKSRFSCSICDFTSKNGETMKWHINKDHKKYSCNLCKYSTEDKSELNNHIKINHKENENTVGTMILHDTRRIEDTLTEEEPEIKKRRKSHNESLKEKVKVKTLNKKSMLNSWREKILTAKKKVATIQEEHGGNPDFLLLIKNNIQEKNTQTQTAGKYMVIAKGPARKKFLGKGVKFSRENNFMMANYWDMKEEIIENLSDSDEEDSEEEDEEETAVSEEREEKRTTESSDSDSDDSIPEKRSKLAKVMKVKARKVLTPGAK